MFKRDKTPETAPAPSTHGSSAAPAEGAAVAEAGPRDRSQGKKGPTPRRRDQEAARRRTLVPEDRKGLGLNLDRSASANITLPWEAGLARGGLIRPRDVEGLGREQRSRFDIRGRMELPVGAMSGGNQQKVLLAKWLVRNPRVFIVDEPTRGVDVGAKMAIYQIIRDLAASGIAVIVVSSELEEVLGLSHRVLVMSEGRQTGILGRHEATPPRVMALAVGDRTGAEILQPTG